MRKIYIFTGLLFFAVYTILCCYYWKERIIFVDTAYQFFKIINFEKFNVEAGRYSAIVTQLITLAAVKAGAGLKALAFLFSLSFAMVFFLAYLLAVFVFRNAGAGLMIIATLCLGVRQSFYHTVTETHQALVYSLLFFAWLYAFRHRHGFTIKNGINLLGGLMILALCWFAHPIAYPMIIIILFYYMIDTGEFKNKMVYSTLILTILAGLNKYLNTPSSSYEGQFVSQISHIPELILKYNSLYSAWFYRHMYSTIYWVPLLLVVISIGYNLAGRKYRKAAGIAVMYFGFLAFSTLVYNKPDSQVMLERTYMPLALIASIPFVKDVLIEGRWFKPLMLLLFVAVMGYSVAGIFQAGKFFTKRLDYMSMFFSYMEAKQCRKMVADWEDTTNELVYMPWAYAVESLIYSSFNDKNQGKTIYINKENHEIDMNRPDLFLYVHFDPVSGISMLNDKYFALPLQTYCRLDEPLLYSDK